MSEVKYETQDTVGDQIVRLTMLDHIGRWCVMALCGGRLQVSGPHALEFLDSAAGHIVEVSYDRVPDAYTVRRLFRRGGKTWEKGVVTHVYAEQLPDVCFAASCWADTPFGGVSPA